MKKLLFLLLILYSVFFVSCKSNTQRKTEANSVSEEVKPITLLDIIKISSDFVPQFEIVATEDISYKEKGALIIRMQHKIALPQNLSENEVKDNLRKVAIDIYSKYQCKNVSILAYSDKNDVNRAYTIAMYELCPYGDWSRTNENVSDDKYKENFIINDSYFKPIQTFSKGTKIELFTKQDWSKDAGDFVPAKTTNLSNSPTDFNEEVVKKIKNGTKATIIDVYSQAMTGGSVWVVYKVKLSNNSLGWVLSENVIDIK